MTLTDIAKQLNQDHQTQINSDDDRVKISRLPAVFFMTDHNAAPQSEKVIDNLGDNSGVILRDYSWECRAEVAQTLANKCREHNILFLVAADEHLAEKVNANGIHLPEALMGQAQGIRNRHSNWVITTSCHNMQAVTSANQKPIDAALVAPVFPTKSHPETFSSQSMTLGPRGVREMVRQSKMPLYGLGGINVDTARELIGTGVIGLAAIRGFDDRP